jgi:hypothetical protein
MLAVFSDGTEVIVCEVDSGGEPICKDYFNGEDERDKEDYDYALVEGPIEICQGHMRVEPERTLTGRV